MSSESWPPPLKEWVAKCLGQMTDTNRTEAQAELRQVIADAFVNKTLWTTDWAGVQLQSIPILSLLPKPSPSMNILNNLKRKINDGAATSNKKTKKISLAKTGASNALDPNDLAALNRRAARFQREHEIERQKGLQSIGHAHHHFSNSHFTSRTDSPFDADEPEANSNVPNWDRFTIVGTSQETFKDYLRLTSASISINEPKPEQIRPYSVLQETLNQLKKRWREKANYSWICSQFKSLRQDLTVQRIKNEFTVAVYEIHARMALEVGDMVEYNQCQAMLRNLYELGIPGKVEEFTAYRILMLLHGRNRSGQLTDRQKTDPAVRHALDVQRALAMGNYHSLFDLYLNAPNMGAYIMDHFIDRERIRALMVMTKSYRTLSLSFIQNELAFETPATAREFLSEHRAGTFQNPNSPDSEKIVDCKPAAAPLAQIFEEKYRKVQIKGAV
ncbi:uncharacterized protein FIBRA_02393 [Fibroporia radiculosa]|uniref:PCI domain-containing protein n=1 Tax=Fibroporia radiculosa TaxID=599839 RepID=J4G1N5_9APHY|nr:uncharacterized protein FIBRA_02393 [Fibroporia radiculosa]CCM00363.1 predicted protein [Fibroporia radiculosa]